MANFQLNVSLDGAEKLSKMAALLTPKLFDKALAGGVRYAARAATPAIGKAASSRYGIRSGAAKDDVGRPRFYDGGQSATISISRKPRTAAQFGGRLLGRGGYSWALFKGQRQVQRLGFIGTTPEGATVPFIRLPGPKVRMTKGRYAGKMRQRIDVIRGVSTGSMFLGDSRFGDVMKKEVEARMSEQFLRGVDRELGRAARGF